MEQIDITSSNIHDITPAIIAKRWRRIGNRIRGKVSVLVATEHGKRKLKEGTAQKLKLDIISDLAKIATSKKQISNPPENEKLKMVLRHIHHQQKTLWKGSEKSIAMLASIPSSESEVFFVREFFREVMHISRERIEKLLIP